MIPRRGTERKILRNGLYCGQTTANDPYREPQSPSKELDVNNMNRYVTIGTVNTWSIIGLYDTVEKKVLWSEKLSEELWNLACSSKTWYDPNFKRYITVR